MASIDGKHIANSMYHAALVSRLSIGFAKLTQMAIKGSLPKLDTTARDAGMMLMNVSFAILTKDELIKRKIIPSNISP